MDTTNTDFYPYQFKPVLSFLDSPRTAYSSPTKWVSVRRSKRLDLDGTSCAPGCPLRQKWKQELATKFSIDADIMDARELLEDLQRARSTVKDGKATVCERDLPRFGSEFVSERRRAGR